MRWGLISRTLSAPWTPTTVGIERKHYVSLEERERGVDAHKTSPEDRDVRRMHTGAA